MSLELAAKHLAAQGRGPDSRLVHMSPREVAGLQALAMAHGGSLSVNPKTGLPEAGFLDKMLPMLIGAGLTAATGGAAAGFAPWMLGLGVGGFEAARTGNLSKGLLAGLGAYGGAGLAGGLLGAGAAGAAEAGASQALAPQLGGVAEVAGAGAAQAAGAAAPGAEVLDAALANSGVTQAAPINMAMPVPQYIPPNPLLGAGAEGTVGEAAAQQAMAAPPITTPPPQIPALGGADMYADAAGAYTPAPSIGGGSYVEATGTPAPATFTSRLQQMGKGIENLTSPEGRKAFLAGTEGGKKALMYGAAAGLPLLISQPKPLNVPTGGPNPYRYRFEAGRVANPNEGYTGAATGERRYFDPRYVAYAGGGPVEQMSNANAIGANTGYPMANIQPGAYATPYQQPIARNVIAGPQDTAVDTFTGAERMAGGGISHLGDYSDGGRLLKGPGDGVSDSIPAVIGQKQPARLADGEFVVPARIVSELGNGSTDAGARKLYAMMDRIQSARGQTTGKGKVAKNSKAEKYLPA